MCIRDSIHYIPTTRYYSYRAIISKGQHKCYLISREFDQQFEREVSTFAKLFPHGKTIMLLRRHDSWIASQYRRFAKNGFYKPFEAFMDMVHNEGRFKKEDLDYFKKIEFLETHLSAAPLVLLYDDFLAHPLSCIEQIAQYCNANIDLNTLSTKPKHTSYNTKQIKAMQAYGRIFKPGEKKLSKNPILKFFQRMPVLAVRYSVLYGSLLMPKGLFGNKLLINPDSLAIIHQHTQADWDKCVAYAKSKDNGIRKQIFL
jgi:hypothetical protein